MGLLQYLIFVMVTDGVGYLKLQVNHAVSKTQQRLTPFVGLITFGRSSINHPFLQCW